MDLPSTQILATYNDLNIVLDADEFFEPCAFWVMDRNDEPEQLLNFPPTETGLVGAVQFLLDRATNHFFDRKKHLTLASRLLATEEKVRAARDEILRCLNAQLPRDREALSLWIKKARASAKT